MDIKEQFEIWYLNNYISRPLFASKNMKQEWENKKNEIARVYQAGCESQQAEITRLQKQNDVMKKAICIYSREMLGDIDWQSDEQAINYMLSFTEENPHGDEALATVKVE